MEYFSRLLNHKNAIVSILFLAFAFHLVAFAPADVTIIDGRHYSQVFGEVRNFRIFLPPGYFENPQKRYPVIYFFHGWSQRYFGASDRYADFDKGDENKGDNIANFVSKHEVIVVKADGYNRSADEKYYVRPWNIGPAETFRQFPIYFPELVNYIDGHYNTIADREHRGISGLSMGGFMTFWIGGKYPDLLSAAGNFCGSPEFEVGPKAAQVEYRHIDMFKNYGGMRVRLNYGDKDFIRGYHQDMNRIWPQLMDNYEYKMYDAAHSTCGMGEMFSFLLETFKNPLPKPAKWDHIDLYPSFSVWDYEIKSDRMVPGFTIFENVDQRGFKCSVREFLPDGELLTFVNLSVTTSPRYEKNTDYLVNDINVKTGKALRQTVRSDQQGRLLISLTGGIHEIGINKKADKPNLLIASWEIPDANWATSKKEMNISIRLLNKGLSTGKNITAHLSATRGNVEVIQGESDFENVAVNEIQTGEKLFKFRVNVDSIEIERFKLTVRDADKNEWVDYFEIPIKRDLPEIKDFVVADGQVFTVAKGGNDSETLSLGNGNGDGVANPGESIVLLVKDKGKYWRTDLTFSDPYINPFGINKRKSDYWGEFDHVGGSAKYKVPLIASNCPDGRALNFFAEYWLPDFPYHVIKKGVIRLTVTGKDATAPAVRWVQIPGDNVLQVKIDDGSEIRSVRATLIRNDDPQKYFEVELKDDGQAGDPGENDNVFSKKIPDQYFGRYRVVISAVDSAGNNALIENPNDFVLH